MPCYKHMAICCCREVNYMWYTPEHTTLVYHIIEYLMSELFKQTFFCIHADNKPKIYGILLLCTQAMLYIFHSHAHQLFYG